MQFSLLLAALALLQLGAAKGPKLRPPRPCVKGVHILATRGDSTEDPPYGGLSTTVSNITKLIPHSNAMPNKYPIKDPVPIQAIVEGTHHLKRLVESYVKRCPETKIVLAGYSDGGVITMNAMCGFTAPGVKPIPALDDKYAENIVAAIVYGDESRRKGESYNRGTCKNNGIRPRKNASCGPYHDKIRSYCDRHDPLCCLGGTMLGQHYDYPNRYDHVSSEFAKKKFDADP